MATRSNRTSRPNVKHARLAENAAREEGATSIRWENGGKHTVMVVSFDNGLIVRQSLPKGRPAHDDWWTNWTRQRMRRELRAYLSTATGAAPSPKEGTSCP
jgi:hypothetical protein